ncbi:hypothetical protein NT239_08270 [Chitinibacter sp. SCUT-21]|uniref:hypothetical protein n=1 Tax=Chitinibacter sp. SCUT-21 TaxID=2970891 RepID=UPI0035A68423
MTQLTQQDLILLILIPLLVGIMTNFLWENLVKSFISGTTKVILKIGTLGLTASIDSIYKDVARRNTHKPIMTLMFLLVILSSGLTGATSEYYNRVNSITKNTVQENKNKDIIALKSEIKTLEASIKESEEKLATAYMIFSILLFCS